MRSEAAARNDELTLEELRRLIDAAPSLYLVLRPGPSRFTIVAASDAYLCATMTRREQIVGRDLFEVLADNPADSSATGTGNLRVSLERVVAACRPDRIPAQRYPVRRVKSKGDDVEERHWNARNVPVLNGDGRVGLILHYLEDVTELVHWHGRADAMAEKVDRTSGRLNAAEVALRAERERLELILDSVADYAIFTTDLDRRVASWNTGAERMLGWVEGEIIGCPADLIFTQEDRATGVPEREAAKALAEGRAENERWYLHKDGTRLWASGLSMPLRNPESSREARPAALLFVLRDRTERRRAEERRALLVNELNHRVKNTLVTVQSLALVATHGASPDLSAFAAKFQRRILALARAHDLLTREDWTGAPLGAVLRAGLASEAIDRSRVDLLGCEAPGVFLPPGAALTLAMAVHELTTNALRHGALSVPGGNVHISCRALGHDESGTPRPTVEWVERGGPPVAGPPARRGFGLRLLERGLAMQAGTGIGAEIRFESAGLWCMLRLPSRRVIGQNPQRAYGT